MGQPADAPCDHPCRTSQLPVANWYQMIGESTHADAILDRLLHNAIKLELKGESMRKSMNKLTQGDHSG
ncbi:ATP-binding protein [Candidatus Regiella insecticola]